MSINSSTPRNDQSTKLSVTVKRNLERKYHNSALEEIRAAIARWIKADANRGINTVHVELDNPEDATMKEYVVEPVSGKATPEKIKHAIDHLWSKVTPTPDYLVLFGGHDIVPMFEVTNPTYLWEDEDDDKTVLTDNPYASSARFRKGDENSYMVVDRVIGRIPDMMADSDPAWFVEYLETAIKWKSKPDRFYKKQYVICTGEAKDAGLACVKKAFPSPTLPVLTCPPDSDISTQPDKRLLSPLHMIKCHGNNKKDATFWGFEESFGNKREWYRAINSATLRHLPHLKRPTVVATMCCYGAEIFSPTESHPHWPMASTYLRKGAVGFVGPTKKAWVGLDTMNAADWIVTDYLRRVLEGASIGRALLESKQDNPGYQYERGRVLGPEEQKTVVEYILLGDPSIHPVSSVPDSANELALQERRQRRVARAMIGAGMRDLLPTRSRATLEEEGWATEVYASDLAKEAIKNLNGFSIDLNAVRVQKVDTRFPDSEATATDPSAIKKRESLEYYWTGKRDRGGDKQLCLLRVETDRKGRPWRTSVMYTS